jgi:hypothetical protein
MKSLPRCRGPGFLNSLANAHNAGMPPTIPVGATDDPGFIELSNSIARSLIQSKAPERVWLIEIDNWFDHKWLHFSGIGVVDFPLPALGIGENGALCEFRQDKLTFPPFTPNRVRAQWSYIRSGEAYVEAPLPTVPHSAERQSSARNLQRRVQNAASSGLFIWYSDNTVANGRGSLMAYVANDGNVESWFASFVRKEDWRLHRTEGISRDAVQRLLVR